MSADVSFPLGCMSGAAEAVAFITRICAYPACPNPLYSSHVYEHYSSSSETLNLSMNCLRQRRMRARHLGWLLQGVTASCSPSRHHSQHFNRKRRYRYGKQSILWPCGHRSSSAQSQQGHGQSQHGQRSFCSPSQLPMMALPRLLHQRFNARTDTPSWITHNRTWTQGTPVLFPGSVRRVAIADGTKEECSRVFNSARGHCTVHVNTCTPTPYICTHSHHHSSVLSRVKRRLLRRHLSAA